MLSKNALTLSALLLLTGPLPAQPARPLTKAPATPRTTLPVPAGYHSAPYARLDKRSRLAGDLQRLYRQWLGQDGQRPTAAQLRTAFPQLLLTPDARAVTVRVTARDVVTLLPELAARGFHLIASRPKLHFIEGRLPLAQLAPGDAGVGALAGQGLLGVVPVYRPAQNGGLTTSQAAYVQQAARVQATAPGRYDGAGLRIGVMSDSYNALGGAGADVASGDLPSGLQVLQDLPTGMGSDEGRAMCQLVHDVAPAAQLAFSSVFISEADFADQILRLADPAIGNCTVLTDDVYYFAEPWFQDGVIAQAVDSVVSRGAVYFSSAGNQATQSCEWAGPALFVPGPGGTGELNFSPTGSTDTHQRFTLPVDQSAVQIGLQWAAPYYTTGDVTSDLDLYLLNSAGDTVAAAEDDNVQNQTPFEFLFFLPDTSQPSARYDLIISRRAGTTSPTRVKYVYFGTPADEWLTQSNTVVGHCAAQGAMAVAAVPFYDRLVPEPFTSEGNTNLLYTPTGQPLAALETRSKPDLTACDGTVNTFFGGDLTGGGYGYFFGTSAAAPHAAAVAALVRQANPTFTPAQLYARLKATALDLTAPGQDARTGAGLVDAWAAIYGPATAPTLPLIEDLAAGALPLAWEMGGRGAARAQVLSTLGPASGRAHLVLDAGHRGRTYTGGQPAIAQNEVTLHADLSGAAPAGGWLLTFREKEYPGETDTQLPATFTGSRAGDGVTLSVDGGLTWNRLVSLTGTTSTTGWQTQTVNLTQFAQANSLTLGADTRIRFQQAGRGQAEGSGPAQGGIALDDIALTPAASAPVALFSSSQPTIGCPGMVVQFQDQSFFTPTSRAWSFPGGTPATSTAANPSVTYTTPGTYAVTLTVTNAAGTTTRTTTNYVTVYGRAPLAAFETSRHLVCPGGQVAFADASTYCATTYAWTFQGGSPATSTSPTPTVTYPTAGVYQVRLIASNPFGSDTSLTIVEATPGQALPVVEQFPTTAIPQGWHIINPDNRLSWTPLDTVLNHDGSTGGAMLFPFYSYASIGARDTLQAIPVELTGQTRATLRFDVAYAAYPGAQYTDSLVVDVYALCSRAYLGRVYEKSAFTGLPTRPQPQVTPFLPAAPADWRTEGVDLTPYVGQAVLLRFVAFNYYGNNLFLDNVNVDNRPLGVAKPSVTTLRLYPNPAHQGVTLTRTAPLTPATAQLLDGLGRIMRQQALPADEASAPLDVAGLPAGVYTVRVGSAAQRLVVE